MRSSPTRTSPRSRLRTRPSGPSFDRLKTLAASSDDIEERLEELRLAIPAEHKNPAYDRLIEEIALPTGAFVTNISWADEILAAGTGAEGEDEPAVASPPGLVAMPIIITVTGTRDQGFAFLSALQFEQRFITVNSMTMDSPTTPDTAISMEFQIKAFVFVLTGDVPQPEDPAATDGGETVGTVG